MLYKNDWDKSKERFKAWWENEIIDRPVIQVTAPRSNNYLARSQWNEWDLVHNLSNAERVIELFEKHCDNIYFGGESFPNFWINFGPGIMSAFIGTIPEIREDTVWFETPKNWEEIENKLKYDENNIWFEYVKKCTTIVCEKSQNRYFAGMTDLGGNLDILAALRGTQNLLIDIVEEPNIVNNALLKINKLWFDYYNEINQILEKRMEGTSNWMSLWSPKTWYPLQCDFSSMISPKLFSKYVAPSLEEQCNWLGNNIYHWDGPGQLPHLDILLEIPNLQGIQWTPGEGNPGVGSQKWFSIYKKIQEKKKLLVLLGMAKEDIKNVLRELSPKGLLISTTFDSSEEAQDLLKNLKW